MRVGGGEVGCRMASDDERRVAKRFPQELEVDLHSKAERIRLRAVDVSRHGMFIACTNPPPMHTRC